MIRRNYNILPLAKVPIEIVGKNDVVWEIDPPSKAYVKTSPGRFQEVLDLTVEVATQRNLSSMETKSVGITQSIVDDFDRLFERTVALMAAQGMKTYAKLFSRVRLYVDRNNPKMLRGRNRVPTGYLTFVKNKPLIGLNPYFVAHTHASDEQFSTPEQTLMYLLVHEAKHMFLGHHSDKNVYEDKTRGENIGNEVFDLQINQQTSRMVYPDLDESYAVAMDSGIIMPQIYKSKFSIQDPVGGRLLESFGFKVTTDGTKEVPENLAMVVIDPPLNRDLTQIMIVLNKVRSAVDLGSNLTQANSDKTEEKKKANQPDQPDQPDQPEEEKKALPILWDGDVVRVIKTGVMAVVKLAQERDRNGDQEVSIILEPMFPQGMSETIKSVVSEPKDKPTPVSVKDQFPLDGIDGIDLTNADVVPVYHPMKAPPPGQDTPDEPEEKKEFEVGELVLTEKGKYGIVMDIVPGKDGKPEARVKVLTDQEKNDAFDRIRAGEDQEEVIKDLS